MPQYKEKGPVRLFVEKHLVSAGTRPCDEIRRIFKLAQEQNLEYTEHQITVAVNTIRQAGKIAAPRTGKPGQPKPTKLKTLEQLGVEPLTSLSERFRSELDDILHSAKELARLQHEFAQAQQGHLTTMVAGLIALANKFDSQFDRFRLLEESLETNNGKLDGLQNQVDEYITALKPLRDVMLATGLLKPNGQLRDQTPSIRPAIIPQAP